MSLKWPWDIIFTQNYTKEDLAVTKMYSFSTGIPELLWRHKWGYYDLPEKFHYVNIQPTFLVVFCCGLTYNIHHKAILM